MKNFLFQKTVSPCFEKFYVCNVLCINVLADCGTCGVFWLFFLLIFFTFGWKR